MSDEKKEEKGILDKLVKELSAIELMQLKNDIEQTIAEKPDMQILEMMRKLNKIAKTEYKGPIQFMTDFFPSFLAFLETLENYTDVKVTLMVAISIIFSLHMSGTQIPWVIMNPEFADKFKDKAMGDMNELDKMCKSRMN